MCVQLDNTFTTIFTNTFNNTFGVRATCVTMVECPFFSMSGASFKSKISHDEGHWDREAGRMQKEWQRQRERLVDGYIIWLKMFSRYKVYPFIDTIVYVFSYFAK